MNKAGFTPLHHAAQQGHSKVYQLLISAGADSKIKTLSNQLTPIDIARRLGYVSIVEQNPTDDANSNTAGISRIKFVE
jgi:ankyrin repeat protein